MSTFHGLEMAKRALSAQQAALYTTGHNIANANTEGYSRQRVNFNTSTAYPPVGRNRPQIPGHIGTGVEVGSIERVRNKFLDTQFRTENSRAGFWSTQSNTLRRMEEMLNEPSETGLSHTIGEFWQALEDLSVNPDSGGARAVAAQRGLAVTETFNHLAESLRSIQSDVYGEMNDTVASANSLLSRIDKINTQLKQIEPHGYLANDLYDQRDLLIDELSGIMNISVSYDSAGGNAQEIAQGIVTIELATRNGTTFDPRTILIDGNADYSDDYFEEFMTLHPDSSGGPLEEIRFNDDVVIDAAIFREQTTGSLTGLVDSYGYRTDEGVVGHFPEMIDNLNQIARAMAEEFNAVHKLGGKSDQDFFVNYDTDHAASTLTVHEAILRDPNLINANTLEEDQDLDEQFNNGQNALNLAKVFSTELEELGGYSVNGYFERMIGIIGVNAQEANSMADNTSILRSQVEEQRMSVSAVSLDEEMTNMLKFQHAYNASARSMTAIDELLDRIINGMGLVGK